MEAKFKEEEKKNETPIDPNFNNSYRKEWLQVIRDEKDFPYDLYMTKVDVNFGNVSKYVFYKMQIVHDKNTNTFILFTRYGGIGQDGQYQHTPFST